MNQHISHRWLHSKLTDIVKNEYNKSIRGAVAQEALLHDSLENFFYDLSHYGCICGMVSSLIYYCDTHKFYDAHYDEIEEIRIEFEESMGSSIEVQGDLKNFYAWFAFEHVAFELASELRLDT